MDAWEEMHFGCQLGTGTWAWGDKQVWGYGKGYSDADIKEAFETSNASGVPFFDTAEVYGFGRSETFIGKLREGKRITVATKFMPFPWRLRRSDMIGALKRSLKRLGASSVELYQIHWPIPVRSINAWMDAFAEAVKEGLTRSVGVSNFSADQMKRAHERLARHNIPLLSNQVEFSLLHRKPDKDGVRQTCKELGVKLIAYSPLAMGVLTGKYSSSHKLSGYRGIRFNRYLSHIENLASLLREIGQGHGGKSPSQVSLNWCICKDTFPIPGAKNANQARENTGGQGWKLTNDELQAIERAADAIHR